MSSRADKFTQENRKLEYFSDFLDNFEKHPINNSLARITNEDAVKQSIRNLIKTNRGERFYLPYVGSDIEQAMFDMCDTTTAENIGYFIKKTIEDNEPRARLLDVLVKSSPDSNSFAVTVVFSLINNVTPITLQMIVKRVR